LKFKRNIALLRADSRTMPAKPQKCPGTRSPLGGFSRRSERPILSGLKAAKMTPDQIAEAQRLAREWKPK
jgi:hypothetical protein